MNLFHPDPLTIPTREAIVHVDDQGRVDASKGLPRLWAQAFRKVAGLAEVLQAQGYVLDGPHETRLSIDSNTVPSATLYYETDRGVFYSSAYAWSYAAGVFVTTIGHEPQDLGPDDVGFRVRLTDVAHELWWDGQAWTFADGGNGFVRAFVVPPPGNGWQLCDGSNTTYVQAGRTLSLQPVTTPNLSASYLKGGAANSYTGQVVTTGGALTGGGAVDPSHVVVPFYFRR